MKNELRDAIQVRLNHESTTRHLAFQLRVVGDRRDNGWLYVVVQPDREGVSVRDYVELLQMIEEDEGLRSLAEGAELLLVPALPDESVGTDH